MKEAIYPGSFDPITNGHIDIVNRACKLFDRVHIAVIINPDKTALFSIEERIALIRQVFLSRKNVVVDGFEGLLADFADQKNIYTVIRGLRAISDFDYEFQMALTNRHLNSKIDTICMMTDEKYSYLSSSITRQLAKYNGNIKNLVPATIEAALRKKLNNE